MTGTTRRVTITLPADLLERLTAQARVLGLPVERHISNVLHRCVGLNPEDDTTP